MRKKLILLLAVAVLTNFVGPAMAQVPDAVPALPPVNPPMSAKSWSWSERLETSTPLRWLTSTWCPDGLETCIQWVEFEANQGPIGKVLGLPAPAVQEAGVVHAANCGAESGGYNISYVCFVDPFRAANPIAVETTNNGSSADTLFEFCQHGEYRVGNVLSLPAAFPEFMAVDGCGAPECMIHFDDCKSGIQISVGGSVCLTTGFGTNGFAGQHNLSPFMGVESSIWLDWTNGNGVEIRAGVSVIGGQQFTEPRR